MDNLEEDEENTSLISVERRILASPRVEEESWRISIFQMLVRCGNQAKKLIIDEGNCMNVVSSSTVERLKLPIEPHPYKVAWIDKHFYNFRLGPFIVVFWIK